MADGTSEITAASKFINSTTEPAWSDSKHDWYNGADRCLFAVSTDADSELVEFFHTGGNYVLYATSIESLEATDIDTTWTDVTLTRPIFAQEAECTFFGAWGDGAANNLYWRTNGVVNTAAYHAVGVSHTSNQRPTNTVRVITDADGKIEVGHALSNTCTIAVHTNGWYFPTCM